MTFWTDERVTELREHFAAGKSATQIAIAMGFRTRGPICGKLARLGVVRRDEPITGPRLGRPSTKPPRVARRKPFRFEGPMLAPASEPAPPRAAEPPGAHQCDLLELRNETCRWPVSGDGPPYRFCGSPEADQRNGVSYCRPHARMAYRRPGEREAA